MPLDDDLLARVLYFIEDGGNLIHKLIKLKALATPTAKASPSGMLLQQKKAKYYTVIVLTLPAISTITTGKTSTW